MNFVPTIRPAEERDAPFLIDIDVKCFEHSWLNEEWSLIWNDNNASVFVACVYGNVVGFMATERQVYQEGFLLNHIYKVAVRENFRGHNLGKKLLAYAYDEAINNKMDYLSMSVPASMTVEGHPRYCVPWINKMGFKAIETLENTEFVYGQKEEVILFMLEVPNAK